jgi:hypothetical protein
MYIVLNVYQSQFCIQENLKLILCGSNKQQFYGHNMKALSISMIIDFINNFEKENI